MNQRMRVMLSEGPKGTPLTWEAESLNNGEKVKILSGNGYEHFEFAHRYAEFDGEVLPVYRWCYRTYIAE
ncbi:DUF5988 family protein [Streptomyces sp. NPDC006923]|uniref:DUF5988 family protein n=1 Tax=Streptomyces sp. NPDC006923 TaxID=3155355 RepID=UPI0033E0619C